MSPFRDENQNVPAHKLVDDYLWELKADRARTRFVTEVLRNYEAYLSQRVYLQEITEAHALVIQGYIVGMSVRQSSVDCLRHHLEVLSDFYDFLIEKGLMAENPVHGANLPDR